MDPNSANQVIENVERMCAFWKDIQDRKAKLEEDEATLRAAQVAFVQQFPEITSPMVLDGFRVIPRNRMKKMGERLSEDIFVRHYGEERGRTLWQRFQEPVMVTIPPKPTLKHLKEVVGDEFEPVWNDEEICQREAFLDITLMPQ